MESGVVLLFATICISVVSGAVFKYPGGGSFQDHFVAQLPPWGYINVQAAPFNATGNGVTDDTPAIQSALDTAGAQGGGCVFFPVGNYVVRGTLQVPPHTSLKGVAGNVFRSFGNGSNFVGTTLQAYSQAGPFITLQGPNSGIEGLQIFYPEQTETNPPKNYPATIQGGCPTCTSENLYVLNVLLVNPFFGIDFATYGCARHFISKVYGQPLDIGISVDQCYDIGRIEHIHFWPFWSMNQDVLTYINNNAFTFYFQRSDWEIVNDVFSWGYHVGITFTSSKNGATNGQFSNINFDNVDVGLDVYSTQAPGIQISNLNLANAGGGSQRIGILGHPGGPSNLIVSTVSFWGEFNTAIDWSNEVLSVSNANVVSWNPANPAFNIMAGRAMISNCYFADSIGTAINIGGDTDRVSIIGNDLVGNKLVINNPNTINVGNDP